MEEELPAFVKAFIAEFPECASFANHFAELRGTLPEGPVRLLSPKERSFSGPSYYKRLLARHYRDEEVCRLAQPCYWLSRFYGWSCHSALVPIEIHDRILLILVERNSTLTDLLALRGLAFAPRVTDCTRMTPERIQFELNSDRLLACCKHLSDSEMTQLLDALTNAPHSFDSLLDEILARSTVEVVTISSDEDDGIDHDVYDYSDNL